MNRDIRPNVLEDLKNRMVFVGGPRQVGKTTFSRTLFPKSETQYLNWDNDSDRKLILNQEFPSGGLLVLDELHKYRKWRNLLKGYYDKSKFSSDGDVARPILVSGSARLDYYLYGGDSLQGRYHYWRMHPLTLDEIQGGPKDLLDLLLMSGFPEPFFSGSHRRALRWQKDYRNRFLAQDLRDLEMVQDIGTFELMTLRLPDLVGSPLSVNALREDLQVAHRTLSKWLDIHERLYGMFRLAPFGSSKIKAVKKEKKHYLYCWAYIAEEGPRFENLVACHLLKWIHNQQDGHGRDVDLRYFRDTTGQEVDFVIVEGSQPKLFLEVKISDDEVSPALRYLSRKFPKVPAIQIHLRGKKDYENAEGIRVSPAHKWLRFGLDDL